MHDTLSLAIISAEICVTIIVNQPPLTIKLFTMKNLKFALLIIVLLAAIPSMFFAQIKRNTSTILVQQEQVLEEKKGSAISCGENYISVLTVSIAHYSQHHFTKYFTN